jgi:hypothetical protein
MKKFSNVTGFKVNEEPKQIEQKIDEVDQFKIDLLNLMDSFLKVKVYGPIHRKLMRGELSVDGKDLLAEAIIILLTERDNKSKTKLLENLKTKINNWEVIDSEIEKVKNSKISTKNINRVVKLLDKYSSDEETLVLYVESTITKFKSIENLSEYSQIISESKLSNDSKNKLINIYNQRIKQISSL